MLVELGEHVLHPLQEALLVSADFELVAAPLSHRQEQDAVVEVRVDVQVVAELSFQLCHQKEVARHLGIKNYFDDDSSALKVVIELQILEYVVLVVREDEGHG